MVISLRLAVRQHTMVRVFGGTKYPDTLLIRNQGAKRKTRLWILKHTSFMLPISIQTHRHTHMHMCVDAHTQSLKNEKFKAEENIYKVVRDSL